MDYIRADRKQIEQEALIIDAKNQNREDYFTQQREDMQNKLLPLYKVVSSNDMKEVINLQSSHLSLRQEISEELSKYLTKLSKERAKFKKIAADRMEYYLTGYGIKTSNPEKVQMIDRDLRENQRGLELLEAHIEFLRECRTSCDQIGYAIKNRISLMAYL